ncbi:hypothetical protein [Arthrobacter sp. ISL-95]|uniref:hypothetical protein n=1 Tax=Arthrobacter sp. ISL-95 TaxID=2819116 RepID=UPI001BE50873|nr:hypothetical protein [Arthrobacter sp. ISL-95]MBT2587901.1 hypothetical protein [Arthrobacter sp. ISL-95]
MDTKHLVQASATAVTITTLREGDVYKRLNKDYSGYSISFGVVTSVLFNGEDAAITAVEYSTHHSDGFKIESKVFGGDVELLIFHATKEEIEAHLDELQRSADYAVAKAEKDLSTKQAARNDLAYAYAISAGKGLTEAQHVTGEVVSASA